MRKQQCTIVIIIGLLVCLFSHAEPVPSIQTKTQPITAVVAKDVYNDYLSYMDGRSPTSISSYDGPHSRRDVIELVLFYQALRWGGYKGDVKVVTHDNIRRELRKLAQGSYTTWTAPLSNAFLESKENMLFTDPVIYEGQYEVGLFTQINNPKALTATDLKSVKHLCIVSSRFWSDTWLTLSELNLPCTLEASRWDLMLKMVSSGRADATLGPFLNTEDMVWDLDGDKLYPIPGIKIALKGDRFWISSAINPKGKVIHKHLQAGLKILHQRNIISKAYQETGVWHDRTKNWKYLNAPKQN